MEDSHIDISILDRVKEAYKLANNAELADFLGVTPSNISNWRHRDRPNLDLIISKCDGINLNYLLKNHKPVWEHEINSHSALKDDDIDFSAQTSEFAEIPFYSDVRVSAGTGIIPGQSKPPLTLQLRKYYINTTLQTSASSLFGIIISGDSMSPKIQPGDMVIIDQSRTQLTEGRVYAVRVDDELYIKQVSPRPGGRLLLISINQEYPPFEVSLDDPNFATIGTAVNLSRTLI